MKTEFTWKKDVFSNRYSIYKNGELIGTLRDRPFSQISEGKFQGEEYEFKTKGFFKRSTEIRDSQNQVIGEIAYNNWKSGATIKINNQSITWKNDGMWGKKWSLSGDNGTKVTYAGSSTKGQINSNVDDPSLILSGLFVTNYYWQMLMVVMVAVLIPLWTMLFT